MTPRVKALPPSKRLIKLVGRAAFWVFERGAKLLRPWSVNLIGSTLGWAFYYLSGRYRRVALANLRAAYGARMTEKDLRRIAKEVFRHFARESLQFFRFLSLSREQIDAMVDLEGREHLEDALRAGKGCIGVTAHYGNWELLARKLVICGYKVNVIARDSDDPGITDITTRMRQSGGYHVFDRDQPIIGAYRALKNNEFLGILPDQNDSRGIFVDFFGRPAATATGPAVLSLRSGAPITPVFASRLAGGQYRAVVHPPIEFQATGDSAKDERELTALITQAIEREVRDNPTQWLWIHDRWKALRES